MTINAPAPSGMNPDALQGMDEGRRNEKDYESYQNHRPDWRSLRYGQLNRAWNADRYESNPFGEDYGAEDFEEFGFEPERSRRAFHREYHDQSYGKHEAPDRGRGYHQNQRVYDHGRYMSEREYVRKRDHADYTGKGPRGYKRADARIYEEVCDALYYNPDVDARDIEVSVLNGVVTLKGGVDERHMKGIAEDCAFQVTGVHDVKNQIRTHYFGRDNFGDRAPDAWHP